MIKNKAYIRKDLLEMGLGVPVGNTYYWEDAPLEYRWVNENHFEVFYNNEWQEAESMDWEFEG